LLVLNYFLIFNLVAVFNQYLKTDSKFIFVFILVCSQIKKNLIAWSTKVWLDKKMLLLFLFLTKHNKKCKFFRFKHF
jgi:hypothetical protein